MPEQIDRHALKNHLYRAQAEAFKRSEWYVAGAIQLLFCDYPFSSLRANNIIVILLFIS